MYIDVLSAETDKFLRKLTSQSLPRGFYLGGGTAIALQLGHRKSQDLDFFTPTQFNEQQWEQKLGKELGFKLSQRDWQTLVGFAGKVKISLLVYLYRLIGPLDKVYSVFLASLPDLAAMKLDTILGRGTKRDMVDIYFLAKKFGLPRMFKFYQQKYGNLKERELMLKKALVFFDEAENDEMPAMAAPLDWGGVKQFLVEEVKNLELA